MIEYCNLRVLAKHAHLLFNKEEGRDLGDGVLAIQLRTMDPRFKELDRINKEVRSKDHESLYYGWELIRKYSKAELVGATTLVLKMKSFFEPVGEECGTRYDEEAACRVCGAGAIQLTDLFLSIGRIPKSKDISSTIAGEIVVSSRLRDAIESAGMKGIAFGAVRGRKARAEVSGDWSQLIIPEAHAQFSNDTVFGNDPFDLRLCDECVCPSNHISGLNRISEVTLKRPMDVEVDFDASTQFISVRRGVLRPRREVFLSQRAYHLFMKLGVKGCGFEVVHVKRSDG